MTAKELRDRIGLGHVITLAVLAVQTVALIAVLSWRIGAVEARLEVLDARLWGLASKRIAAAPPCPPDVTRVVLR